MFLCYTCVPFLRRTCVPFRTIMLNFVIFSLVSSLRRNYSMDQGWREWVRLSSRPAELEEAKVKIERELTSLRGSLEAGQQQTNELREQRHAAADDDSHDNDAAIAQGGFVVAYP